MQQVLTCQSKQSFMFKKKFKEFISRPFIFHLHWNIIFKYATAYVLLFSFYVNNFYCDFSFSTDAMSSKDIFSKIS